MLFFYFSRITQNLLKKKRDGSYGAAKSRQMAALPPHRHQQTIPNRRTHRRPPMMESD